MEASAMERLQSRCKNLKILYVEDDEATRKYTQSILSEFFDCVIASCDGQSAYDLFFETEIALPDLGIPQDARTQKFDLIITDLKIPKLDGIALITKIRKICKETIIIVTSAHHDVDYLIEAIRLGVSGYLLKPIELDQFLECLALVVEKILQHNEHCAYVNALNTTIALQQSALEEQLHTDWLTKFPNKSSLDSILEQKEPLAVPSLFLMNIDNFKHYNTRYGLDGGNRILKEFSHHLNGVATLLDYEVFRISSNEFAMLRLDEQLDFETIYEDIMQTVKMLNGIELTLEGINESIVVTISMGVTFDQENLFGKAFTALDFAKQTGKPFSVYTNNFDEIAPLAHEFQGYVMNESCLGLPCLH